MPTPPSSSRAGISPNRRRCACSVSDRKEPSQFRATPIPARDLGEIVDETLQDAGLAIDRRRPRCAPREPRRRPTREPWGACQARPLCARPAEVTAEDVEAILSDVSSLAMDAVVDAAFAGDLGVLETGSRRLAAEGIQRRRFSARLCAMPCRFSRRGSKLRPAGRSRARWKAGAAFIFAASRRCRNSFSVGRSQSRVGDPRHPRECPRNAETGGSRRRDRGQTPPRPCPRCAALIAESAQVAGLSLRQRLSSCSRFL